MGGLLNGVLENIINRRIGDLDIRLVRAYPRVSWKWCKSRRKPSRSLGYVATFLSGILAIIAAFKASHVSFGRDGPDAISEPPGVACWPGSWRLPALARRCTHSDRINAQNHRTRGRHSLHRRLRSKMHRIRATASPKNQFSPQIQREIHRRANPWCLTRPVPTWRPVLRYCKARRRVLPAAQHTKPQPPRTQHCDASLRRPPTLKRRHFTTKNHKVLTTQNISSNANFATQRHLPKTDSDGKTENCTTATPTSTKTTSSSTIKFIIFAKNGNNSVYYRYEINK